MSLQRAARNALKICLAVKPGEEVLIVTDWKRINIAKALYEEALKLKADPMIELMHPRVSHGAEPPATVAQAMAKADVVIAPTEKSLSHTDARRQACEIHKTRIASLPTITEEVFIRGLLADYDEVKKISQKVYRLVTAAAKVRLTSPQGTDLTMEIPNEFELESGLIRRPGAFSNLPDGEVCAAPKEGSTNGVLVIDRYENMITKPTRVEIKNGCMQKIEQNPGGKRFQKLLDDARCRDKNDNAYNIAELGIGTNPSAKITGCVLEDEKVFGTIHIAFGDNTSYDGGETNASCHEDVSVFEPSLELDGKIIMDKGKLL
jgi:leucyl aminopeptidase (aminopeptidase T)